MTLQSDVKEWLEGVISLEGGVHLQEEAGEISRQSTPAAFDENGEILPCLLITEGTEFPRGPYVDSVQTPVQLFFYQRSGFATIDEAMEAAYQAINGQRFGWHVWRFEFNSINKGLHDSALDCSLDVLRFQAVRRRVAMEGS